jgi:hypothetical protein
MVELLEPHFSGHPITYNHYLTDNVQKAQADRRRRTLEKNMKNQLPTEKNIDGQERYVVTPSQLLVILEQRTENDMDTYAANLAADYMEAYYKVSQIIA